ncbi:response regulator [Paenibacillus sp. P25]|nr:response regulator [Paenibacillus sp. P25]
MWKLVIIDDDHIILKGLTRHPIWEENGFKVVGSAHNGEDGLEIIERERPHVVISDIRMPFMDGLELTEAMKSRFPNIRIILMTSYDDFIYAQKALKLKVFDFVLKPVENDKLLEVARRAAAEWEQEQSLTKKVLEGIPFLKRRFYENLLRGRYNEEQIQSELAFLELRLEARRYAVILLIADDYYETGPKNRFGQEPLKFCIFNLAQELLDDAKKAGSSGACGIVFEYLEDEIAILYCSDEEEAAAERELHKLGELIRGNAVYYLKTTVTVGIGSFTPDLTGIARSYRDAKAATEYRHLTGTNQVLTYRDALIKPQTGGWVEAMDGWEGQLAMKTKLGLGEEALEVLRQTEERILSGFPLTLEKLQLLGIQIAFVIINAFQDWSDPPYRKEAVDELLQELRQRPYGQGAVRAAPPLSERNDLRRQRTARAASRSNWWIKRWTISAATTCARACLCRTWPSMCISARTTSA